jgi:putative mRNA 3-end processing factor
MLHAMRPSDLLTLTPAGLYCPLGGFHVDPLRPVARALVTHGHSDHARAGHEAVLATAETLAIMALRYGEGFAGATQAARFGEATVCGDVRAMFFPAGHVLGSAQILIEAQGARIVVSGDYKRAGDPTCAPFEPIRCDMFITEATFGLPIFCHPHAEAEIAKLLQSVALFPERTHLVGAYALGKAQRLIALIRQAGYEAPIYIHGALEKLTDYYASQGVRLGDVRKVVATERTKMGGAIVICPPSAVQDLWARRFPDPVTAFASGWMRVRARARQSRVELPLVISDHCDWEDLATSIVETGAAEVWVTHGQEEAIVHWCLKNGIAARPLHLLGYGDDGESEDMTVAPAPSAGGSEPGALL